MVDLIQNSQNEIRLVGNLRNEQDDAEDSFFSFLPVIASTDEKPTIRNVPIEYIKSPADYSERRSIAITIPDYSLVEANKEKFYVSSSVKGRSLIVFLF